MLLPMNEEVVSSTFSCYSKESTREQGRQGPESNRGDKLVELSFK
jgi:hypothetical protein